MKVRKRKTTLGILREGRRLIASGHWTQGVAARDAHGRIVSYASEKADRWCAFGACFAAAQNDLADGAVAALEKAAPSSVFSVTSYNDAPGRAQAEIVALFDRAIAAHTG